MDLSAIPAELTQLLATQRRSLNEPFSDEIRALVVQYTRARRAAGWTWSRIAADLPVSSTTASKWLQAADPRPVPVRVRGKLRPPKTTTPAPRTVTLVSPGGWRLEGLWVEDAARLLGSLP